MNICSIPRVTNRCCIKAITRKCWSNISSFLITRLLPSIQNISIHICCWGNRKERSSLASKYVSTIINKHNREIKILISENISERPIIFGDSCPRIYQIIQRCNFLCNTTPTIDIILWCTICSIQSCITKTEDCPQWITLYRSISRSYTEDINIRVIYIYQLILIITKV